MTAMIYDIGNGRVRLSAKLAGLRDEKGRVWNQVAVEGSWRGHKTGEFTFNREVFEQVVENFALRSDTIPLTYGHPDDVEASRDGAAGWIHELRVGETEAGKLALFALMEFTEKAQAQIEAKEQKYCSVVLSFESIDGVTGEAVGPQLHEVGLVLSAFISGMTPLAASDAGRIQDSGRVALENTIMDEMAITKKIMKELGENFTIAKLTELAENEMRRQEIIEGKAKSEPEGDADEAEDVAAGEEKPAVVVEAGEVTADTVDLEAEPGAVADEGDAMVLDTIKGFAEQAGMDVPALLAIIQEHLPALLETPEDGGVSEDPAAMGKYADEITKKLGASEVKCGQLVQERDVVNDKLIRLQFEKDVDLALFDRKITDAVKIELLDLHGEAPKFARKRLSTAMGEKGTVVPVGKVRNSGKPSDAGDVDGVVLTREDAIAKAEETLRLKAANEGVSLRTKELRSQSYELAKSMSPEAFGIKTSA